MKKVLIAIPLDEEYEKLIRNAAPGYDFRILEPYSHATQEDVKWAEIIIGNVNPEFIDASQKIEWIHTASAGVEPYIKPGVLADSTKLTNSTGAYGLAIAEHMLGMLLEIIKKLSGYRDLQAKEEWHTLGGVKSIHGSVVLVLGLGDIGGEFAQRCKALGAHVIGMRRTNHGKPDYIDEICLTEDLDKVLPRADVVAIALPGTKETNGMISRDRINSMKEGAVLLNVGRGNIVDTEALCDALESGKLMGAGLDVTEPEPLPKGHRLWKIPTAVITPHISGYYHLKHTHNRIVEIAAGNLKNFCEGKPLDNEVDFAAGYKKTV